MGVFGDLIGDVTSVVTKPISAITNAISGGVSKIAALVVGLGKQHWGTLLEWLNRQSALRAKLLKALAPPQTVWSATF